MTVHPIDTEALRRDARRVISDPYGGALETWWASHALRALDALAAAEHRADEAEARIKAVRELHHHDVFRGHLDNGCAICGHDYPCPTIRAMEG